MQFKSVIVATAPYFEHTVPLKYLFCLATKKSEITTLSFKGNALLPGLISSSTFCTKILHNIMYMRTFLGVNDG